MTHPLYNPREASGPTLKAMLVGRWPLVEEILADLRRQATSASRQHWLLRGPRGIGKTHLIGVVYHRVREDRDLKEAYLPIWLAEMEAYTFYSTAVLLLEVAGQLAEELRKAGDRAGAAAMAESLRDLEAAGDAPSLFEEVTALLKNEARRREKVLLVLMENLDAMLAGFRSQAEARRFRSVLSEDKELLFLSTTPTRYLRQLSDPEEPLYGHLKERTLAPLTEEEVGDLFGRFVEITGAHHLEEALGAQGEGRLRRRLFHRLTGGNPRALVMAFSVLSGSSGLRSMVEELTALLDTQTAYFEARLAQLAPRERSIVAAMALAPTNLTRKEIARATRLPERSLSIQIKRLAEEGHVGQAVGEGGKGTIYELSDGLFRVWFQYRKGRKKLEPLVRFLALWYAPEELEMERLELEVLKLSAPMKKSSLANVVIQVEEALRFARTNEGEAERKKVWTAIVEEMRTEEAGELPPKTRPNIDDSIATLREIVERFGERRELVFREGAARALVSMGQILGQEGRLEEAEAANRQVIERFGERREAVLQELVARAYIYLATSLRDLDRTNEAIAVLDEVLSRYGGHQSSALAKSVAVALLLKGSLLRALDRSVEAIAVCEQLISGYSARHELAFVESVATALTIKGVTLFALDQVSEAIATYDEIVSRYAERHEPALVGQVVRALVNKGLSLGELGETGQAINLLEKVVSRYGEAQDLRIQREVPRALFILALFRGVQGNPKGAIHALRDAVTRLETVEDPELLEVAPILRNVLTVLEAAQPRRSAHIKKGSATRLRESLGRLPPELREIVRVMVEMILFGQASRRSSR